MEPSLHFSLKTKMKTFKSVICDWFRFMFSIPRAKPMTMIQKFTMWSSLIFYCAGGLVLLVWVQLWKIVFRIDFQGRTESYLDFDLLFWGYLLLAFISLSQHDPLTKALEMEPFWGLYLDGLCT